MAPTPGPAGLIYLPAGVSSAVSAKLTGKYLDWNFRRACRKFGAEDVDARHIQELTGFPIEETRLQGLHMASMLVMQVLAGATASANFTMTGTLLTD
ncbi:hypothetical protein QQX98_007356 [Neonectria punicea]|uniref:Uncharacterized protein n=1 Tax=Neonectria punicea TaxID=979145 RepID=A0ABR1GY83_9HYPO